MLDLFQPPAIEPKQARTVNLLGTERGALPRDEYWRAYHLHRSLTDPDYIERRRQQALEYYRRNRNGK